MKVTNDERHVVPFKGLNRSRIILSGKTLATVCGSQIRESDRSVKIKVKINVSKNFVIFLSKFGLSVASQVFSFQLNSFLLARRRNTGCFLTAGFTIDNCFKFLSFGYSSCRLQHV